ncbi:MAG: OFA family MFS transporter [Acidobacteriota bacterium]
MATATSPIVISRTKYAVAPILMQVLLGMLYSWSVFRGPLARAYGWNNVQTNEPFGYSILALVAGTILGGIWQDRSGPRLVASIGGLIIGAGWVLSAIFGQNPTALIWTYGWMVGIGTGFGYVAPIATLVKWFPDKRGLMVGLAVMGVGVSPLLFAPLIEQLIGKDPARFAETIPRTFIAIGVVSLIGVVAAAQFSKTPPAGWKPEGWRPAASAVAARENTPPGGMLATWQFYALWIVYFLGAAVGLTAISQASPLVSALAKTSAVLTGGVALGIMSVFNGVGRLAWGGVSDRAGRKRALLIMCAVSAFACAFLLRGATGFWHVLTGLSVAAFAYGGFLALMPSLTADYYGPKHMGANYGLVFTAFGISGYLVPRYFAHIVDQAKSAGNVAAGYDQVYLILAGMMAVCAVFCLTLRPPRARAN